MIHGQTIGQAQAKNQLLGQAISSDRAHLFLKAILGAILGLIADRRRGCGGCGADTKPPVLTPAHGPPRQCLYNHGRAIPAGNGGPQPPVWQNSIPHSKATQRP